MIPIMEALWNFLPWRRHTIITFWLIFFLGDGFLCRDLCRCELGSNCPGKSNGNTQPALLNVCGLKYIVGWSQLVQDPRMETWECFLAG